MDQPKYRMYAVSLMAVMRNDDAPPMENDSRLVIWKHRATVCIGTDIDDVLKQCEKPLFDQFPKEKGYSLHGLSASPIEGKFFDLLQDAIDAGAFVPDPVPGERHRTIFFDGSASYVQLDPTGYEH